MKEFLKKCRLPENLEILFMLIIGILLQMTDGSPFSMKERWMLVWDTALPAEHFNPLIQKIIKTILSMIVVVRCATTYAYVVSAMLVIFCLLKNCAPKLMLLWLLIAGVKSILMTFLEALTGVYVCSAFGKIRKACIEFFISKALEIIFAAYLWGNVLNIYQDMERKAQDNFNLQSKDQFLTQKMDFGRLRARSLVDESTLYKTACLNNFEFKDVPQIILQMLRRDDEMSEDSLLGPGMMLASVSNMGSFDNLKTSQSLGELGFTDLRTTQVVGLEDDETLSYREKALKFLKLTKSDVKNIKLNRTVIKKDIYTVDEDIWKSVIASGTFINKPKQARTEVFIREIPQNDLEEENIVKKQDLNKFDYKFGFSLSNLFNEKQLGFQDDQDEEEPMTYSQEDEESDDEGPADLFMSNIKEGTIVQRHHLGLVFKKTKGNEYAQLYKQDFMNRIGPEVFDKATKLPKVTSLTKKMTPFETKSVVSSITLHKETENKPKVFIEDLKENVQSSSSDSYYSDSERPSEEDVFSDKTFFSRKEKEKNIKEESTKVKNRKNHFEFVETVSESQETMENHEEKFQKDNFEQNNTENYRSFFPSLICSELKVDNVRETKKKPCFRKTKIIIKRTGRRKPKTMFRNPLLSSQCPSRNSDSGSDLRFKSNLGFGKEDSENRVELPTSSKTSTSSNEDCSMEEYKNEAQLDYNQNRVYFLAQLLQQPFIDVLMTYYDLKNKVHIEEKASSWPKKQNIEFLNFLYSNIHLSKYEELLQSCEVDTKEKKIWKSKVLKTVESWNTQRSPLISRSYLEVLRKKSIMKKLLNYELFYLLKKGKNVFKEENEFLAQSLVTYGQKWSSTNVKRKSFDTAYTQKNNIDSKVGCEMSLSFQKNFQKVLPNFQTLSLQNYCNEEDKKSTCCLPLKTSPEIGLTDFTGNKPGKENLIGEDNCQSQNFKNETNFHQIKTDEEDNYETELKKKLNFVVSSSEALGKNPEESSLCSQESDEPISLYYSKAANLASPLLDMKRFIYPDHIHYSYKHFKKKGFDVDINGGFPLLVRENLTVSSPVKIKDNSVSENPEFEITRRPMDLSFATTNAFAEWRNNDQNDVNLVNSKTSRSGITNILSSSKKEQKSSNTNLKKRKKSKKIISAKKNDRIESRPSLKGGFIKSKPKFSWQNLSDNKYLYFSKDYPLIEKLIKMHMRFNNCKYSKFTGIRNELTPVQISSTQLHSNKGRINSTYNPAISLQENKSRNEKKKKIETQEKRTNDMFARLNREALFQSKNVQKSLGSSNKFV